jgi:phospho-N-acetylmuramoyl-pentapeptide-transferase
MKAVLISGVLSLLFSLFGTRLAIGFFSRRGYGQEIREDGPQTHITKRGTPTMGGIAIVGAAVGGYLLAKLSSGSMPTSSGLLLLFLFVGMGLVGFLDDFIKVFKQRNLGLRSRAKMIGQTGIALVFGAAALMAERHDGLRPADLYFSTIHNFGPKLPFVLVLALIWLIVTATSNAVNLTDGLDGLATGASVMVFGAYTIVNIWQVRQACYLGPKIVDQAHCYSVRDPQDLAVLAAAITGACFGFLWWNASPAKIFMGDTGSLALGSALAGFAVLTRTEGLMVLLGGLFVIETCSVILQVGYFKATKGKRILRMAPVHHHFEMLGWEQVTVVIRFWIICGLFVTLGLGLFYGAWVANH